MHMSCMYFHSLPAARVVSVGPVCDPQNQVGVISLTGRIQKDKVRRVHTADTVCVQEYHVHSNVDGLRVLPADFLSPRRHHFVYPCSGDKLGECGRSSIITSEVPCPPTSKSQDVSGTCGPPACKRDHRACIESRTRPVCFANMTVVSNKSVRMPKSRGDA